MPLIGGGGAGNVAGGSNPTGIGSTLSYIGDHVTGTSGTIIFNNVESNVMEFATVSNSYIRANIQFTYIDYNSKDARFKVYINDLLVYTVQLAVSHNTTTMNNLDIIFPSDSRVKLTAQNVQDTTDLATSAIITGRVYG